MTEPDTTQHEQTVSDYHALWNGDVSKLEVVSESFDLYDPALPEGELHGRDEFEAFLSGLRAGFPDLQVATEDLLVGDDLVMAEVTLTGTHEGEFRGIPPTGREMNVRTMEKYLVRDGKVQEARIYFDTREIPAQLGLTFPTIVAQLPKLAWAKLQRGL